MFSLNDLNDRLTPEMIQPNVSWNSSFMRSLFLDILSESLSGFSLNSLNHNYINGPQTSNITSEEFASVCQTDSYEYEHMASALIESIDLMENFRDICEANSKCMYISFFLLGFTVEKYKKY